MRLTVDDLHGDDLYKAELVHHAEIYLNGKKEPLCIVADEEAGYIIRHKRDAEGKLIREGDDFAQERLEGKVKIVDSRKGILRA